MEDSEITTLSGHIMTDLEKLSEKQTDRIVQALEEGFEAICWAIRGHRNVSGD